MWVISNFFKSFYFGNERLVVIANSVSYFSGYLSIVAGLIFTYYFPAKRQISKPGRIIVVISVVATLLLAPTSLVAGVVTVEGSTISYGIGTLSWLYAVSFLGALALITRNLLRLPGAVSRQKRLQAQQVLAAFLISALFGLIVNVVMPLLGFGWQWTELSPFIIIPLVGIIAYSIIRHGLFDIRVTTAKVTAWLLTFALFFGSYYC